ncbi:reverse transcriptase [Gossypium australe]|uniref:Reverse transcriptase n=1 Tax=Gossypium australe TaxID=47621 RepID=A0A5B6VMX5_9ROSI|nr:reverse transcriptase [Gossypium australe]
MCMDYRDLDKANPKDNFPLPHIDTLVDNTTCHSLFSFMDGFSEYNQIKMHPEDMENTTFLTMWGTFCYKVTVFRLKNAGAIYQRAIERASESLEETIFEVEKILAKAESSKMHFRGHSVRKGSRLPLDKVKAIQKLPPPRTQNEVWGFLGKLNYISRFISQLTEKCNPIFRLLHRMRDKIFANREAVLRLSLDYPEAETVHVVPFDLAHLENETSKKIVNGSAIADFLASRALEDYEPLNFNFPNEDLMYVATIEEGVPREYPWKLNFDGTLNGMGNEIRAVLVSPNGDHYPSTSKLDFDFTNNMVEYEARIMGIRAAIELKIKVLEVYGDSALVIYQLRDSKLINYRKLVLDLIKEFDDITFCYLLLEENQMADALATLSPSSEKNHEYPEQAIENDKKTLRRLTNKYVLDWEILYKRRKDQVLLRCVNNVEAEKILEEVHEGACGTHANGFTMAKQIM